MYTFGNSWEHCKSELIYLPLKKTKQNKKYNKSILERESCA